MSVVVMTGGTSGFGALTAARLADAEGVRLLLGGRRESSVGEHITLDLTELDSVRLFARAVRRRVEGQVDVLVLNAGVIRPDVARRTVDGFEPTFAVNHLAHYLLMRLLLPCLADRGLVLFTTSGTHDPATGAGLAPPRHADATLLAFPDRDRDRDARPRTAGQHAYTASKLCAVLTARALARRLAASGSGATAIAFDPGQVFGTGLVHDLPVHLRVVWFLMGTAAAGPIRRLDPTLTSRRAAGDALADLALGVVAHPGSCSYAAVRAGRLTWQEPSPLARDEHVADALWRDSADLVGCSP